MSSISVRFLVNCCFNAFLKRIYETTLWGHYVGLGDHTHTHARMYIHTHTRTQITCPHYATSCMQPSGRFVPLRCCILSFVAMVTASPYGQEVVHVIAEWQVLGIELGGGGENLMRFLEGRVIGNMEWALPLCIYHTAHCTEYTNLTTSKQTGRSPHRTVGHELNGDVMRVIIASIKPATLSLHNSLMFWSNRRCVKQYPVALQVGGYNGEEVALTQVR